MLLGKRQDPSSKKNILTLFCVKLWIMAGFTNSKNIYIIYNNYILLLIMI